MTPSPKKQISSSPNSPSSSETSKPDERLQIEPSTKVAQLLDAYPELEETLIRMAPPFKKLKNPILRRSVAKVATLQQAAMVGRLDLASMINQLRKAVAQEPMVSADGPSFGDYLGTAPEWFGPECVATSIDDRAGSSDEMAIIRIIKAMKGLGDRQVLELKTTFLPAPGIDVARKKGLHSWTVQEEEDFYKTYFTRLILR